MDLFDLHCDTPYLCHKLKLPIDSDVLAVSIVKGTAFNKWHQCFAVWIRDDMLSPYDYYKMVISDFKKKLSFFSQSVVPYFTIEGGAVIEDDIDRISKLKSDGVRALTLTWNGENNIAGGVDTDVGLKHFGERVIRELNRQKIVCDLAHLNSKSFYRAIEIADFPVVTHTCCDKIHPHKRNLTDEQINALAQKNGLLGLCFYPDFLGGNDIFEKIYKNVFHLLDRGFENMIAIGSDFDGADMHKSLYDIGDVPKLYSYLMSRGLEIDTLEKVFFKNAFNFFNNL